MIRLLFVDKGVYHYEEIEGPKALLTGYEQLLVHWELHQGLMCQLL